ncbi:non-ribosomal peptide synthetase [Paenibacillus sp. UMB4589-SE434]|uniref:non-ribosomal peptide synthetase n=1 Tax=Paenibacillus sp. UMB4589-SE434 TaxID=3046314 RepID=UPI0025510C10|nr:non-ribosomal peptide synthetase [Paenibacillus sp. UMB4589-SE434]MDK8183094.1 amino acid adenylation domain-containing protein [Paenibacillus sp. UMB4589-SE434]
MVHGSNSNSDVMLLSPLSYEEVRSQIKSMLPVPIEFEDHQNLIELGLDSLQMMRLVNKWRRDGAAVTFAELIVSPRLSDWWSLLDQSGIDKQREDERIQGQVQVEDTGEPFALTDVQSAYWFGRQDDQPLGGIGCHAYLELDGVGVEPARLETAWSKLLMHHPMLRARFLSDGRQEVMDTPYDQVLPVHDLRLHAEEELIQELDHIRERLSHRRLDVDLGQVAGLELSLLPNQRTRLHLDVDLLVADVQSLHILLRDLADVYTHGCTPAAPADWSFAAYLVQEARRRSADLEQATSYWKERLLTLPAAPGLPLRVKADTIKKPLFNRRNRVVANTEWLLLQQRAAAYHVTPAMVLLAAYAEVLDRWSTHSKFLINIPLFARQTGEVGLEDVVADFTNLLLLEVNCSSRVSFLQRVRDVQAQFHQDVAHAAYSGVQLQRDLARVHRGERDFAPVVFACNLGTPFMNEECQHTLGLLSYMISQTPQVWLDFQTYEINDGLLLAWDAVDELFPEGLIDQMFNAFSELIDWLVVGDNNWEMEPEIHPAALTSRTNNKLVPSHTRLTPCIHTSFFDIAQVNPQATALIDSGTNTTWSYRDLADYALRVAALLQRHGIREGEPVAITLPMGMLQVAAVLGVLAIGACYVPISTGQPSVRRQRIHKKAAICYVLTNLEFANTLDWPDGTVGIAIDDAAHVDPLIRPVPVSSEQLAYIIFTSGSTGEPKGVEITHKAAWNTIADINHRYAVNHKDCILAVSSLEFDLSVYDLFGLLSAGGALVLITENTRRDAVYWLELMNKHQITIWNSVPVLLDMLLVAADHERQQLQNLRLAMLSGDWIGLDLPSRLNSTAKQCHLVAMGGATEAAIWSNAFDVALPLPAEWTSIPYGRPLTNQTYRVVDDKGRDCPDWVPGELWIGGDGVAQGYRGDEELTAQRFVSWHGSRWYRTGDLGRYWTDGNLEFLGRMDFQVKIRGHRIELGEIEAALKQYPGVRDAVVTAAGDPRGTKHLIGYVVTDPEKESSCYEQEHADFEEAAARWAAMTDAGRLQARQLQAWPDGTHLQYVPAWWAWMERVSVSFMCRILAQAGALVQQGERYTLNTIMQQCSIKPRYEKLIGQWLDTLQQEHFLTKDETGSFVNLKTMHSVSELTEPFIDPAFLDHDAPPAWGSQTQGLLRYLQLLDPYIVDLLTGKLDPLALYFSDEHELSPAILLNTIPGTDYCNGLIRHMLDDVLHNTLQGKEIRILEIGARNEVLTESLLSLLSRDKCVYTCADSSTLFINRAKHKFSAYPFVQYELLDIDQHPGTQGYELHGYDVIITSNALHRARNIHTSLTHIQDLLAPGGLLIIAEMTRNSKLQHISTAFLEAGGSSYEDGRRAEPLLAVETWQHLLQSRTFVEVEVFPRPDDAAAVFAQHVFVAQAPHIVTRFQPEKLSHYLNQKLPDYMVPAAFIPLQELPLTANGKVDRQALPASDHLIKDKSDIRYQAPQTEVEQLLTAIWCELFDKDQVGINDNYFTLGGDSLVATKLIGIIRTRFEVDLSLGSIFERPSIAGLAEHIQKLLDKKTESVKPLASLPLITADIAQQHMPFPLTDIQQAYWVGRSGIYALGNVSTHCYFEIEGTDLELERIERAWQRLIEQHGMMRTVILPGGQLQQILPQVAVYSIFLNDLRGQSVTEVETALQHIRNEMSHQVLSTDQWPLFDVRATCYGKQQVRLHISFDNLIFDGWSMFHLLSEWNRLYHEPAAPLPVLELSFRDYVLAQEQLKQSDVYLRDEAYWLDRLPDLPPAPELPLALHPDQMTEQRFCRQDARLSRNSWQQLKTRSADAGLTPSGLLLTAYAEVLSVWSKRPQFTINLTQFNRLPLHPQVQEIVGDFTSLTLLAVDQSQGNTFMARGRNLQHQLWQDLDHPHVGGVQVQRELARMNGEHQGVSMPVVFTSALGVDQWSGDDSGGKWLGKLVYNITQTPQVWLDHQVVEQDGELLLIWDAVEGLFPEGLLEDMFTAYCCLLQRLADEDAVWWEPGTSLIPVPHLNSRLEANDTESTVPTETLTQLFDQQAALNSQHPAVIAPDRTLTYEDLYHYSNEIGSRLRGQGAKPNTLVAVVMDKGWEQIPAVLGILKSGAAYLPVDPDHPEERQWQLLRDGEVRIVLTQSWLKQKLNWPDDVDCWCIDQMNLSADALHSLELVVQPLDLAYVIYTSGSTGSPKGVMIDHLGAVNTIMDINKRFHVGPQDRVLALSNLNFDLSVYDIFGILAAGASIVMPEAAKAKEPAHWLELLKQQEVTIWNTVPAFMQMMVEYGDGRNAVMSSSLRLVLLSGDWIPLDLPDKIKAHVQEIEVIGLGGATEASIWSNIFPIQEVDSTWKSIPYGRPMLNQRYHVLNERLEDCPIWVAGQLYIGGIGLARGYWNDAVRTNERFIYHPRTGERLYGTGDLGRYLPNGNIEFIGREDSQVKIRGHRIELGEIEAAMKRHDGIKDAIVLVAGESNQDKHLVGYVVLSAEQTSEIMVTEHTDAEVCTSRWQNIVHTGEREAAHIPDSVNVEAVATFMDEADRLSLAYICRTLYQFGVFRHAGERYTLDELAAKCQIQSRYRTLLLHWLQALVEEGLLEFADIGIYKNEQALHEGLAELSADGVLKLPLLSPDARRFAELLERDSLSYKGLLVGDIDPLELFLQKDTFLTPDNLRQFHLAQDYDLKLAREVFSTIVNSYPPDHEVRVLEIGTRAGSLTGTLVSCMPEGRGHYLYVDESTYFIDNAKRTWGESTALEFSLYDMNHSPLQQGYELHRMDVIVADNTLHRSRNLNATLKHLQTLLAPGGHLFLMEATHNRRIMLTTVGFFEDGFNQIEDERRECHLPLLKAENWLEMLTQHNYVSKAAFPASNQAAAQLGRSLIVAQAPDKVAVFQPAKLSNAMRRKLPDYMVPASYVLLDELPLSANGKVDRKALAALSCVQSSQLHTSHVPPSSDMQQKIAFIWEEIFNCKQVGIDDSFFALGGDSLRAIQCINLLKERHQIDLTLHDLFEAPNVRMLAEFLETNESSADQCQQEYVEGTI